MSSRLEWATAILKGLGVDPYNEGLLAWVNLFVAEGSKAENNPDDTIQPEPGDSPFNTFDGSLHVWNYPSMQEGVTAVLATLNNGLNVDVIAALKNKEDAEHVTAAIATRSSWDSAGTLYLRTLPSTRENFTELAAVQVPGPDPEPAPVTPEPVPVVDPQPVVEPVVDKTPPEEAAVESVIGAEEHTETEATDAGKVSLARQIYAKLLTHIQELGDLLK